MEICRPQGHVWALWKENTAEVGLKDVIGSGGRIDRCRNNGLLRVSDVYLFLNNSNVFANHIGVFVCTYSGLLFLSFQSCVFRGCF